MRSHGKLLGLGPMQIHLACRACGGNSFALEDARDDESPIHCRDCNHVVGTLAQLKAQIARHVLSGEQD